LNYARSVQTIAQLFNALQEPSHTNNLQWRTNSFCGRMPDCTCLTSATSLPEGDAIEMSDWLYLELFIAGCVLGLVSGSAPGRKRSKAMLYTIVFVLGAGVAALLSALAASLAGASTPLFRWLFRIGKGSNLIFAGVVTAGWFGRKLPVRVSRETTGAPVIFANSVVLGARLLMASYFVLTGATSLLLRQRAYHFFQTSGYSYPFFMFIEIAECAGALGLLIPFTARWAAIGLSLDMIGAIYTHFHNHFVWGEPNPFSNSLDALKILPVLAFVIFSWMPSMKDSSP